MPEWNRWRELRPLPLAGVAALGVATTVLTIAALTRPIAGPASGQMLTAPTPSPTPSASASPTPSPLESVTVVGGAWMASPSRSEGVAARLGSRLDLPVEDRARSSAGYLPTGSEGRSGLRAALARAEATDGLLVVQGGESDLYADAQQLRRAARSLFEKAAGAGATVVVVGPFATSETPSPELVVVRDAVRRAARQADVAFVDPIKEGWITGDAALGTPNAVRFIGPDGLPSARGSAFLARRLATALAPVVADPAASPEPS